jgi:hypothetical protein
LIRGVSMKLCLDVPYGRPTQPHRRAHRERLERHDPTPGEHPARRGRHLALHGRRPAQHPRPTTITDIVRFW